MPILQRNHFSIIFAVNINYLIMKKLLTLSAIGCLLVANGFTASAQYDTLTSFNGTDGNSPNGSLVVTGNVLMGMTYSGGSSADGNVFSIHTNGGDKNSFYSFNGTHGQNPKGNLTYPGAGHTVYGMTFTGGANGYGCVFSMDTNGLGYRDLWDFNLPPSTNGDNPAGSVIIVRNKLFGMTSQGGLNSDGNIFSIDTNGGAYKDVYDFSVASGDDPQGSLILVGHKLYGMTKFGAVNGVGDIFSIDTDGTHYTDRWNFQGALGNTNGAAPYGSLIVSGHTLFGMTSSGGKQTYGNVFSIDTDGARFKDLLDFTGFSSHDTGASPYGDVWLKGHVLFGMTSGGGVNNNGTIFRIDSDGTQYKDLWDFSSSLTGSGQVPNGNLTFSGSVIYGMTSLGGAYSFGVVFADTLIKVTTTDTNVTCNGSNNGHATAYVTGGISPFTYSWTGGSTLDKATGLSAGSYTVTVTDNDGFAATASVTITQPAALAITLASHTNDLCNGAATATATANTATGGTTPYAYSWSPNGGTNLVSNGLTAGNYTVTVTDKQGCTATVSVSITQPTAITATTYMVQDDGTSDGLAAVTPSGGTGPYTYNWYNHGGATTDTIKGLHAPRNYCCQITDANGCIDTVCVDVTSDVGINTINAGSGHVSVYPNPNNGNFTIESSTASGKSSAEIYNILGEKVKTIELAGKTNQIDLTAQPDGIYLYRVVTENGSLIGEGKLIIQK